MPRRKKLTPAEVAALQVVVRETAAQTIARIDQALAILDKKRIVLTGDGLGFALVADQAQKAPQK